MDPLLQTAHGFVMAFLDLGADWVQVILCGPGICVGGKDESAGGSAFEKGSAVQGCHGHKGCESMRWAQAESTSRFRGFAGVVVYWRRVQSSDREAKAGLPRKNTKTTREERGEKL